MQNGSAGLPLSVSDAEGPNVTRAFGSKPAGRKAPARLGLVAFATHYRRPLLAGIVLLAALLRLNHVTDPLTDTFSWRQASTAMMADNYFRTSWNIFFPEVSWTGPGPNYQGREFQTFSYLCALLYTVFGQHESIGRALAAAFGTWGVFACYMLVRRVWDVPRALATALMLAIVPGAIFIDRSFLPDPAMLSLTITAMWLFVRALQTGRGSHLVLAGVFSSWAFLTKLPGIVALAPMIYAAVVTLRRRRRERGPRTGPGVVALLVTLVLVLIPIAAYYWWAVHLGNSYPPYHVAGSANWVWKNGEFDKWIDRNYYLDSAVRNFVGWLWTAPVIGLVLVGCVSLPPAARETPVEGDDAAAAGPPTPTLRWFFHFWFLGCTVLYGLGARELSENVWNYHVFNLFAAAMAGHALVLIASAPRPAAMPRGENDPEPFLRHEHPVSQWLGPVMTRLRGVPRPAWRAVALAAIIVAFGQYCLADFYNTRRARDSHQLGLTLREHAAPEDLVVTMADDVGDPIAIYYSHRRGWVFPQAETEGDTPDPWKPWNLIPPDPKRTIRMFEDLRAKRAKWLGIVTKPLDDTPGRRNFWKDHPEVVEHIDTTCEFVEKNPHCVIYRILSPEELAAREAARRAAKSAATTKPSGTQPTTTKPS